MDILSFALDLVAAEMGMDRALLSSLERKVRTEQGGCEHYIASGAAQARAERDAHILRLLRDHPDLSSEQIGERVGLSGARVRQIRAQVSPLTA